MSENNNALKKQNGFQDSPVCEDNNVTNAELETPTEVIRLQNVTMRFNMPKEKVDSIKEYVIRLMKKQLNFDEFIALKDISLSINKGDVVGFVGLNGSGKSTMLKVISGILKPSEGTAVTNGSISPLIELGAGFDMDLTARENIYLNGSVLGFSKKFLDEHYNDIIDFSELHDFQDVAIKNFSSGMVARLGFSIATVTKPEILIVDEILSVGDFLFQEKCERRISNMMANGTTVLIVSHSIDQIERLCNRVIWLEKGRIRADGDTKTVCEQYKSMQ